MRTLAQALAELNAADVAYREALAAEQVLLDALSTARQAVTRAAYDRAKARRVLVDMGVTNLTR